MRKDIHTRVNTRLAPSTLIEASESEYMISLGDLLRVVWRRLWIIVLVAIVLTGAAVGFSFEQTPMYEASIKILVGQEQGGNTSNTSLGSEVDGLQKLTQTMVEAVNSRPVAEEVIEQLGLGISSEDFLENLSAEQVNNTQFVQVNYRDSSPERAQQAVNTVGSTLSEQISEVSLSTYAITITVWEGAEVPDSPASPNPLRDGLFALVLAGMLGVGLALLLEHLGDRWRSSEEVE